MDALTTALILAGVLSLAWIKGLERRSRRWQPRETRRSLLD